MNILRFTFIIAIFLIVFSLCLPVVAAKHIIVVYDVSGSMVGINIGDSVKTYMKSEDIRRANDYITNLLFEETSQPLRNAAKDSYIKKCDAAYAGKSLYQSGDILTYATYTDRRDEKITREQVGRDEFYRQLPTKFPGQVSYLDRAKVEVYDELYLETDDGTYWVFVTDGDIDRSEERDPKIRDIFRRLAEIEEEFHSPMIVGIFVNNHVKIEVRRIQKRMDDDTVFIANRLARDKPVKEIQFSKNDAGQLISETLIIDTKNSDKTKFKLNSVNVEIFDKIGEPLKIVNGDNGFGILKIPPVLLNGNSPPYEFQIPLPANPETKSPDNALKLKVIYDYNGKEKIYPMPLTDYEPVIKSIYVSNQENPDQQDQPLALRFSEDGYLATLVVQSENPTKTDFRIENIRCQIQYKDKRKLCDVRVATIPKKLDEPFQIKVLKVKDLDWYGNKLVLDIGYHYKGTAESETIEFPFELSGGISGILMVIFIILGLCLLTVIVFALVPVARKMRIGPDIECQIMLGKVDQEGIQPDDRHFFTLKDGDMLSFGAGNIEGSHFNVGSPAVLRCRRGEILLCENVYEENGRELTSGETLPLTRDEGGEVHIYFEIVDEPPPPDPGSIIEEENNLLPD